MGWNDHIDEDEYREILRREYDDAARCVTWPLIDKGERALREVREVWETKAHDGTHPMQPLPPRDRRVGNR